MDQTWHSILSVQKLRFDLCSLLEISKLRVAGTVSQRDQPYFLSTSTFQSIDSPHAILCSTVIPKRFPILQMPIEWNTIPRHLACWGLLQHNHIDIRTFYASWTRSMHRSSFYAHFNSIHLLTNDVAHLSLLRWRVLATRIVFVVAQQNFLRVRRAIDSLTFSQNHYYYYYYYRRRWFGNDRRVCTHSLFDWNSCQVKWTQTSTIVFISYADLGNHDQK